MASKQNKMRLNEKRKVLKLHMRGDDVARLQERLRECGCVIEDQPGHFGRYTRTCVQQLQREAKLEPTGIVDEKTDQAIAALSEHQGAAGDAVAEEAPAGTENRGSGRRPVSQSGTDGEHDKQYCDDNGSGAEPKEYLYIRGQIRQPDGQLASGKLVRAFDKDMRSEELLGQSRTDLCGFYEIKYQKHQFRRAEKVTADLLIRIYDEADEITSESAVHYNAADIVVIDLIIGGGEYLGPSLFERLMAELSPVLEDVPLSELSDDDIQFLFNETGVVVEELEMLKKAAILAADTDIPIEVFYAFFRYDLPMEVNALLKLSQDIYRQAIGVAFEENLIPIQIKASVDPSLDRLEALRTTLLLDEVPEPGVTPVREILETTLIEPQKQAKFMELYNQIEGPIETFWKELRSDPDFQEAGLVDDLQTNLRLGIIAQAHTPMIQYVHQVLHNGTLPGVQPSNGGAPLLADLAQLDQSGWRGLIDQQVDGAPIGFPEMTPGETPQEKADNFAAAMAGTVEAAFPTQVVAARIRRDQPSGADDLTSFFEHNPEFNIKTTGLDVYLAEHPTALYTVQDPIAATRALGGLQRLYRLTDDYEATRTLSDAGLTSAKAISAMQAGDFVSRFAPAVGGELAATKIHQKASQTSLLALALYGKYGAAMNAATPAAIPGIEFPAAVTRSAASMAAIDDDAPAGEVPDWETLFGTEDLALCECAHCRSVYSPAAYLVDILNLLKPIVLNADHEENTVAELLFSRRPDIAELELSCENTNTALPHIDLVNEILEGAIAPMYFNMADDAEVVRLDNHELSEALVSAFQSNGYPLSNESEVVVELAGNHWRISGKGWLYLVRRTGPQLSIRAVPQTYGTSEELCAFPRHINRQAYDPLKQAYYPWSLPFDLWWETVRLYLGQMGVRRADLMEAFQVTIKDEGGEDELFPSALWIACERLDISPRARLSILHPVTTEEAWGVETVDPEDFRRVDFLLERSRLSFDELEAFLATRVAREWIEGGAYTIRPLLEDVEWTCDTSQLVVDPTPTSMLDAFHRFIRLWRRMGWNMHQLDRAVMLADDFHISDETVIRLSHIKQLETELKLPVDRLLDLWDPEIVDKAAIIAPPLGLNESEVQNLSVLLDIDPLANPAASEDFVRQVRTIQKSPFTVAQLDYIYRHSGIPGDGVMPLIADVMALFTRLQDSLMRIAAETVVPAQPTLEALQRSLAVLMEPAEVEKLSTFLLSVPADSNENRALIALYLTFVDPDDAAQNLLGRPAGDEALRQAFLAQAVTYLLEPLLKHLRLVQSENQIIQILSETLSLDADIAKALLSDLLKARMDESTPAMADYLSLVGEGVSVTYFSDQELGNAVTTRNEPTLDFDWGSGAPHHQIVAEGFSAEFKAKIFIPAREGYTFHVRTGSGFRFWESPTPIDPLTDTPFMDQWDNTLPHEFSSAPFEPAAEQQLYYMVLRYKNSGPNAFLRLSWSGSSFKKTIIPTKQMFTHQEIDLHDAILSYMRLHKAALLVNNFKLTLRELVYFSHHSADFAGFDINALALEENEFNIGLVEQWKRLWGYVSLRDSIPKGDMDLIDLFKRAGTQSDDVIKDQLANLFMWDATDIDELCTRFGLGAGDFKNDVRLHRLRKCMALRNQLGVSPETLFSWSHIEPDDTQAEQVAEALSDKYDEDQWLKTGKVLSDELRKKRRDALVAYLVANPLPAEGWNGRGGNGLFNYFLIDVEMSPCQLTSRVKQAISSVQLFIQRSLMNLEPDVQIGAAHAKQWRRWMRNYRVWEANRKVFLYPENWVEPGLRNNKSPFFEEMENELLQNDVTNNTAETALLHYLEKLDDVARLQVCGMYYQLDDWTDNGRPAVDVLHVFARTFSKPHIYYYRKWVDSACWTAWEKVEVDIEGDHLIPVVFNRRVYLFWPVFTKKAVEDKQIPEQNANAAEKEPMTIYEIQFAWSVYQDNKWSAKKVTNEAITTSGRSQDLRDFVFKSGFDQQQNLAIGCYGRRVE